MNELKTFENAQFGQVRVIDENGKPLFCGSDVARRWDMQNLAMH